MKAIAKALIEARSHMGKLLKDGKNPHFRSNYATLKAVIETAQGPLSDAGIVALEYTTVSETGGTMQHLDLIHAESGDTLPSEWTLEVKDATNPQQVGSAQTYARRYLWTAAAGLAPEDDDGNAAAQATQKTPQAKPKPKVTVDQSKAKNALKAAQASLKLRLTALGYDDKEAQVGWITKNCAHYAESKTLNLADVEALTQIAHAEGEKTGDFLKK